MNTIVLLYQLLVGFDPNSAIGFTDHQYDYTGKNYTTSSQYSNTIMIGIKTELRIYDNFFINGELVTYADPSTLFSGGTINGMSPYQIDYTFGAGVRFKIDSLFVRIGYEHACYHPVVTSGAINTGKFGGYNRIYIKLGNMED